MMGELMLAMSDGMQIAIGLGNFGLWVVATIWLSSVARRQTEVENQRSQTQELMASMKVLSERIDVINRRLERGDNHFDQLAAAKHELELKFVARIGELKDMMIETFVTKENCESRHA